MVLILKFVVSCILSESKIVEDAVSSKLPRIVMPVVAAAGVGEASGVAGALDLASAPASVATQAM